MTRDAFPLHQSSSPVKSASSSNEQSLCCCLLPALDRSSILQAVSSTGLGLAPWQSLTETIAGPINANSLTENYVLADKILDVNWISTLFARGGRTWYEGVELATIEMAIGGICAGQVYLSGDGRLV